MKKVLKLTLVVAMVLSSTTLFAQKLGRINSQEVIMAMPETAAMQTSLQAVQKDWEENLEAINVEFNNKLQEFQKGSISCWKESSMPLSSNIRSPISIAFV